MYSPGIRSTIGGSVHPFENKDPLGKALADSFEQGAANAVQGVANWYQNASAHQEGIGDDLLRLMAGGVRNTTNAWKAATAEQEGITDDILRGVGWTAHQGFRALDAASHYGGKAGGNIARLVGVDPRIGGALGNVAGEALLGFGAKAAYKGAVRTVDKVSDAGRALAYGIGGTGGASATLGPSKPIIETIAERLYPGTKKIQRLRRSRILADTPAALEYRQLIAKHNDILADIKPTTVDGGLARISPLSKTDFEGDLRQLIRLKKELDLPSATSFREELGAFVEGNTVFRYSRSKDKLVKQDYEGVRKRLAKQGVFPTSEAYDPHVKNAGKFANSKRQALVTEAGLKGPEKDHIIRLENQISIIGKKVDKAGNLVDRPPEFIDKVARILTDKGYPLGDVNPNFLEMSEVGHRTGKYSRHSVSQALTDFEFPHTYIEADSIQVTLKNGQKKWLNVEVKDIDKGTFRLRDGDKIIPDNQIKSKGNYKYAGREYEKGQRQGLSLTTRKILGTIDDPEELAKAYIMFVDDAGAKEMMTGIQTAASFIYDSAEQLDDLTKQIRNENVPNMIKFLNYALETKQFKGDKVYTDLRNRFVNRMKQNMADYGEDLRRDANRILQELPKSDGRRHIRSLRINKN